MTTANEAASLLKVRFLEADQQAIAAAIRYKNAARRLGLKLFFALTLVVTSASIAAWLILAPMMPTAAYMQERRGELVAMEAQVAALKKKGASLQWGTCGGEWCFRTNGASYGTKGDTYSIPFRKR